ncbi:MAG: hypothetical protein JRN39_03295 [Nitrososphaerota archaeon]|nr:hypothetical protein [Nitrososphaerota archaeon]
MSTDSDVKELAELRERLEERIRSLQEELETSKKLLTIVDRQLSEKSFVKATDFPSEVALARPEGGHAEVRPMKRQKDGYLLGNASVAKDALTIDIAQDVAVRSSTPPFKSYFIGKVLGAMRTDDERLHDEGRLPADKMISFDYEEPSSKMTRITVRNYGDKVRLNEIISTATWTLTKMLEKQA